MALKERAEQVRLQIKFAEAVLAKSEELNRKGAVAGVQLHQERSQLEILRSQETELQSQYDSRAAEGVRSATAELSRREQELADAKSQLRILRLGSRCEEIEAERARCDRLSEELDFLKLQQERLVIKAPSSGTVSALRLDEKVGQFAPQGSLICHIEDASIPHVEIFVSEDDAAVVRPGQAVQLKARSLPFETFTGIVDRVAPAAAKPQEAVASQQAFVRQAVVVHCTVEGAENKLKSGMTGFGRIYRGRNNMGSILASKAYRYVRTEFWW
jgi:HlyD family secretion protein